MIGICLPSQPTSEKHNQDKKEPTYLSFRTICQKMCPPCLIIIQSCYFYYGINKPFACSRCMNCVSRSVHVISKKQRRSRDDVARARAIVLLHNLPINQFDPSYVTSAPLLSAVHISSERKDQTLAFSEDPRKPETQDFL